MVGTALLGKEVVTAHTIRTDAECFTVGKEALLESMEKFKSLGELGFYLFLVISVACHHHDAAYSDMGELSPFALFEHVEAFMR